MKTENELQVETILKTAPCAGEEQEHKWMKIPQRPAQQENLLHIRLGDNIETVRVTTTLADLDWTSVAYNLQDALPEDFFYTDYTERTLTRAVAEAIEYTVQEAAEEEYNLAQREEDEQADREGREPDELNPFHYAPLDCPRLLGATLVPTPPGIR